MLKGAIGAGGLPDQNNAPFSGLVSNCILKIIGGLPLILKQA